MIHMFEITGEEIRMLSGLGMEHWRVEREPAVTLDDIMPPLKAMGSRGGNTRTFFIDSNEDGEIRSIVREGQGKRKFSIGDKVYPRDATEVPDNEAVILDVNPDGTVDVAAKGAEGVGWDIGQSIPVGDIKHPTPQEWAVMDHTREDIIVVDNLDDYATRQQAEEAAQERFGR